MFARFLGVFGFWFGVLLLLLFFFFFFFFSRGEGGGLGSFCWFWGLGFDVMFFYGFNGVLEKVLWCCWGVFF